MDDWKAKAEDLVSELQKGVPVLDGMNGSITVNLHKGKPVDCVVEPVIRIK